MASSSPSPRWSKTRNGRFATIASVVALFVMVLWMAMKSGQMMVAPLQTLYVPPEQLALGDIWETDRFTSTFLIYNPKQEAVTIRSIDPSCSCASVKTGSLVIRPGASVTVPLVLDLTYMPRTKSSVEQAAQFGVDLIPQIEGISWSSSRLPESWTITANVLCPFAFDTPRLHFGEVWLEGREPVSKTVGVVKHSAIRDIRPEYDQQILTVNMNQSTQTPNKLELEVAPRRDLKPGIYTTIIKLVGTAPNGQRVASSCRSRIIALEDVHAIPNNIAGTKLIGEKICETVVVAARSHKAIEILRVEADSEMIKFSAAEGLTEGVPKFNVTASVQKLGPQNHQITVHLRSIADQSRFKIIIPVRVHGIRYSNDRTSRERGGQSLW